MAELAMALSFVLKPEIDKCKRIEWSKSCTLVRCRKRGARRVHRGDEDETKSGQNGGKSSQKKARKAVKATKR
jgi:hypothetical protein